MSRIRRWYQIAAAVPVVAVFATLYAWSVPAGVPSRTAAAFWLALLFAMPTGLWLLTSWLLVHHWWQGAGARLSAMDAPGRLLAATVATLPEPRQRWGEAMLAELAQAQGRSARWRFALSSARAALSLSLPTGWPVLAIATGIVVAAVPTAYKVVAAAVPGLGFFAANFVALVGAMVVLGIARARRVSLPVPVATVFVTGAVAASVATTAVLLLQHPSAAEGLSPARAAVLAVAFTSCLWMAAAPPRRTGSSRLVPHLGVGAAVIFVLGILAAVRANIEGLPAMYLLFAPALTFIVPATIASMVDRSLRAGVQAGIWTAIAVIPLSYSAGLVEGLRQYAGSGMWTFAGDISSAGFNFGFTFITVLAIPVIGFPFAVLGATVGALYRSIPPARNGAR